MALAPTSSRHPAATALLNLVVQLALLTVIPLALWKLSGDPIPHRLPSWDQIQIQWRGIETQPSQLAWPILRALADLIWIIWAWNAAWTAIALLWVLLHLPRTILPGTLAAITPALAIRALSLGALAVHPAASIHTASAATAPATPVPAHPVSAGPRTRATGPATVVDVVEPGDNLWNLAQHYYHQGQDWHAIYDANQGIEQPDGQRLQSPALIQPGWHLTIPAIPAPAVPATSAPNPTAHVTAPPARPAPTPPHGPATARPTPNRTPARTTPAPAATAPHTPPTAPAGNPGGVGRPAPERPHTVGHTLPDDAGYIGITLIAAVSAAVALLRTRNRHRGLPRDHEVPDLARTLAAVHSAAVSADHYGYRPDEHPGETPPPLLTDPPDRPVLATSEDQQHETAFEPDRLAGPLALTGPGAPGAARAIAISTLATEGHALHTDAELTDELLGTPHTPDQPDWLTTTTPPDGTPDFDPPRQKPATTAIRTPKPGTDYPPGTVLLGHPDAADAVVLDIDNDGTVRGTSGSAAEQYTGTHLHTLTRDTAAELYTILRETRLAPAPESDEHQPEHEITEPSRREEATTSTAEADPRTLAATPLILRVLGDPDILDPTGAPTPIETEQATALLAILALNPDGIRARELRAMEWPHTTDSRPARVTLARAITRIRVQLRRALTESPEAVDPVQYNSTSETYRLNPAIITTDLALIRHLTRYAETAEQQQRLLLLTQAAALHRGPLSPRLDDHHREWLTTARYTLLNEAAALHLHIADLAAATDPETAAHHLRQLADLTPEDADTIGAALRICQRLHDRDTARHLYLRHRDALRRLEENPDPAITQLAQAIGGAPD